MIIGASSGIGLSVIHRVLADEPGTEIFAVSRGERPANCREGSERLHWTRCSYEDAAMGEAVSHCQSWLSQSGGTLDRVVICNGRLHGEGLRPEKRLEELRGESLHEVFESNAVVPALWLKHLKGLAKSHLKGQLPAAFLVLSARVGSIEDNAKGGWYAYRASKAALNMLLKSAAIEYQRLNPSLRFLAFHPGTTDTPLSKPFQRSVPEGKLFTPDFVAASLLARLESVLGEGSADAGAQTESCGASFVAWDGSGIPW